MAVFHGNDTFSILVRSTKTVLQFIKKSFRFLENLFQSQSTENVQNCPVLRQKLTQILPKGATIHFYYLFDESHFSNIRTDNGMYRT